VDVLNCFPVKEEEVLLMEFEERLVLIERVAKTLLDAMIDCILYTCVCIWVCVLVVKSVVMTGVAQDLFKFNASDV